MFNPFLSGTKQLNQHWRMLRDQLTSDRSDAEHLDLVCKFWAKAPMVRQYLDYTAPANWPNPWELISDGKFDDSSLALGMEYTLLLGQDGRWTPDRLRLHLICTRNKTLQTMVLVVDGTHLMNYAYNMVVRLEDEIKDFEMQQGYSYSNKTHAPINDAQTLLIKD